MNDDPVIEPQEETPEPTLRDDLEAAFDAAESPEPTESKAVPEQGAQAAPDEGAGQRARDEAGRFAKKAEPGDLGAAPGKVGVQPGGAAKPAIVSPSGSPVAPAAQPQERAPQSWKPVAREHWATLHPEVRAEVVRREREVATALQETAQARQLADQFRQTVAPFEGMIRAEGGDPLRAVSSLLQTAAALRTAPPGIKAQLVANVIRTYGVPIDALDAALVGQSQPQGGQAAPQYQDPRVDQLIAQVQNYQQQQEQAYVRDAETQVSTFGQDREFFGDLRHLMADVIELSAKHGERLSLEDAYSRAVAMRPDIAKIVQQREAAASATTARAATQRARAAASSVRSSAPVIGTSRPGASLRDDIEAAFESASGR